jgi:hypothetical protein
VPRDGGELKVWRLKLDQRTARHPVYQLIMRAGLDSGIQEIIHDLLPPPVVIRPKDGDLVIIDATRPHAVGGFSSGRRVTIQSILSLDPTGQQLLVSS